MKHARKHFAQQTTTAIGRDRPLITSLSEFGDRNLIHRKSSHIILFLGWNSFSIRWNACIRWWGK